MVPDMFQKGLEPLERQYGVDSLARVRRFLSTDASAVSERHASQRGARYVFPGLQTGPWLDIHAYPEINDGGRALRTHHTQIKDEILARVDRAPLDLYKTNSGKQNAKWRSLYLIRDGVSDEQLSAEFPVTTMLVERHFRNQLYPLGEVFFSALVPGAHIARHCDMTNFFICLHFGVAVPHDCALRVADETRTFEENAVYLFDHSFEHEAWNRSGAMRINLLFDIWHPDLSFVERQALTFCFRRLREEICGTSN